jgi:hypothetical protein
MPTYRPPHRTGHDARRNRDRADTDRLRIAMEAHTDRVEALRAHREAARGKRRPQKLGQHFHPSHFPHLPSGPATGHTRNSDDGE